ncbi:hypothetical protein SAMN05443252_10428 [Bacillus sp. OV322]|nr:hypothetical protein SAMN05443252_10428 [Bacillus sp. OV322]
MKIEWIKIKGFRNFDNEKINFAEQTLIIGELMMLGKQI